MSSKLLIGVGLAGLWLAGCSGEARTTLASSRQTVVNGTISGPEDDAVVMLVAQQATVTQRCTATLIAPNLIITARHCVANYVETAFTCDSQGNLTSGPGGQMGTLVAPDKISVQSHTKPEAGVYDAKGKQIFAGQTTTICLNDIALVVLDRDIPDLPIRTIRLYTGTQPGETMRSVGYGLDENNLFGVRHSRSDVVVDKVGSSQFRPTGDNVPPRSFTSIGDGLCIGDSGGPAFSEQGAVAGIYSKVVGTCTSPTAIDTFTEVAPFATELILPAFQAAGYEPWLEGNSEPGIYGTGGAPGTGGAGATGGNASTGGAAPSATGGTTSAPSGTGGAPLGTGGATGPVVYDQGPAPGGTCACRAAGMRARSWGAALFAAAAAFGIARRRRR